MNHCAHCGKDATHFCTGCGKWLCDSMSCVTRGAAEAIVKHPIQAIKSAPAAAAHAGRVLADALDPFNPFK